MTLRLLALSRYGLLGASSRVRMALYRDALAAEGIDLRMSYLLDDAYLAAKYRDGHTPWSHVVRAYWHRLRDLPALCRDSHLLWVEKELWPWAPAWLERFFMRDRPLVLDFDDAIFHLYDQHPHPLVRRLWGSKIDRLMRRADLVTAGNDYLAQRARHAGARRVEWLPTVVDLARYPVPIPRPTSRPGPCRIVWIGSPSTVHYLRQIGPALAKLGARRSVELTVIGAQIDLPGVPLRCEAWTEAGEAAAIAAADIGIMPLPDSPWERGKCGYKLIQYMACGLPVVASPVGVNCRIVEDGANGFLAEDQEAWLARLEWLVDHEAQRHAFGACGRLRVEQTYSLQANAPRLAGWLRELAGASH